MSLFLIFRILSSIHNQPLTPAFYRLSNQRLRLFLPLVAPGNFLCSTQPSLPLMLLENFKIAMIENLSVTKKLKLQNFRIFQKKLRLFKYKRKLLKIKNLKTFEKNETSKFKNFRKNLKNINLITFRKNLKLRNFEKFRKNFKVKKLKNNFKKLTLII